MKYLILLLAVVAWSDPKKDNDFVLAKSNFASFLGCGREHASQDRCKCMAQFLTKSLGANGAQYYELLLYGQVPVVNPSACDTKRLRFIKTFEEDKFDNVLCFESSFYGDPRKGYVFFRSEEGIPKISKIKW